VLRPNTGLLAGVTTVTGFDDLVPRRYAALAAALDLDELNRSRAPSAATVNLARRCAATVLAADRPPTGVALAPVERLRGPHVWALDVDGAHPLAGWYGAARPVADQAAALGQLARGEVPDGVVLLEGLAAPTGEPASAPLPLTVRREVAEVVTVASDRDRPGWVVVRELADQGWRASVDGQRVAVAVADGTFLAVPVPAGRHEVELRYRPVSWSVGWGLAALGLLRLLGYAAAAIRRRPVPHSPSAQS
jgi:hypothetical protein